MGSDHTAETWVVETFRQLQQEEICRDTIGSGINSSGAIQLHDNSSGAHSLGAHSLGAQWDHMESGTTIGWDVHTDSDWHNIDAGHKDAGWEKTRSV